MIEKLNLAVFESIGGLVRSEQAMVSARALESLLASAPSVFGRYYDRDKEAHDFSSNLMQDHDTHIALLIGIEPINKSVTREEIHDAIAKVKETNFHSLIEILHRIADHGYKGEPQ